MSRGEQRHTEYDKQTKNKAIHCLLFTKRKYENLECKTIRPWPNRTHWRILHKKKHTSFVYVIKRIIVRRILIFSAPSTSNNYMVYELNEDPVAPTLLEQFRGYIFFRTQFLIPYLSSIYSVYSSSPTFQPSAWCRFFL